MSQDAYLLLHLFGVFLAFTALGGVTLHAMNGGDKRSNATRKRVALSFSVGLVLVLIGGFGQLARLGSYSPATWEGWVYAKFGIWLLIGALYSVPYRKPKLLKLIWFGGPTLGVAAGWLALYTPF